MIFIVLFCDSLHMLASMVIVSPYQVNEVRSFPAKDGVHTIAGSLPVLVDEDLVPSKVVTL
jgi:hypothetical protein